MVEKSAEHGPEPGSEQRFTKGLIVLAFIFDLDGLRISSSEITRLQK